MKKVTAEFVRVEKATEKMWLFGSFFALFFGKRKINNYND